MKSNTYTKSSITLPPSEIKVIMELKRLLKAKSNVEVIRKGLKLLKDSLDEQKLRSEFKRASSLVNNSPDNLLSEELDSLSSEGLDD